MATNILFSSLPNEAFPISTGPGDIFTGGAVAFQPPGNCGVIGVSLLLRGYTAAIGEQVRVELYGNQAFGNQNRPANCLGSLKVPPGNDDGSVAVFTCLLGEPVSLTGGQIYWLLVYGGFIEGPPPAYIALSWLVGNSNPAVVQVAQFVVGNYEASALVPAFEVLVAA